jgi:hypothetical protein
MKGIGILGMVFLPGTFVSVSLKLSIPVSFLPGPLIAGCSGNLQHELLWSYREPRECTREMDSVEPVLALLGSGIATDCAYTGNVVLLATGLHPAVDEEMTVVLFESMTVQSRQRTRTDLLIQSPTSSSR